MTYFRMWIGPYTHTIVLKFSPGDDIHRTIVISNSPWKTKDRNKHIFNHVLTDHFGCVDRHLEPTYFVEMGGVGEVGCARFVWVAPCTNLIREFTVCFLRVWKCGHCLRLLFLGLVPYFLGTVLSPRAFCFVHRSTQSPQCHLTDAILPHNSGIRTVSSVVIISVLRETGPDIRESV